MAINSVNDIPAEIKEIAEVYYKGNTDAAFDKAKQLKQARTDLTDLVGVMLDILKDPPLSLFTFYDALIDRSTSTSAFDDFSGFSFDDLEDDSFSLNLNQSLESDHPASIQPPQKDVKSIPSLSLDELSNDDVKPIDLNHKNVPMMELADIDVQPIDDLNDNDIQPIDDLNDNDIQPIDDQPPAKSSSNDSESLFDKLFDENFDVDQALDISFASFTSKVSESDQVIQNALDKHMLDSDPLEDSLSGCNRKEPINLTDSNIDLSIDIDDSFGDLGTSHAPSNNTSNPYSGLIRRNVGPSEAENQNASHMGTPNRPLAALYAVASEASPEDDPFSSFINAPSFNSSSPSFPPLNQTPAPNVPKRTNRPSTLSLHASQTSDSNPISDFFGPKSSAANVSISLNPQVSDHGAVNNVPTNLKSTASANPTTESTPVPEPSHNPFSFKFDNLDSDDAAPNAKASDATPAPEHNSLFSINADSVSSALEDNSFPFNFDSPSDEAIAGVSNPSNPFTFKFDNETPAPTPNTLNKTPVPTTAQKPSPFSLDATPAPAKPASAHLSLDASVPESHKNPFNKSLDSTSIPKQPTGRFTFNDVTPAPAKPASNQSFAADNFTPNTERNHPFATASGTNDRVSRASRSNSFATSDDHAQKVELKNPFSATSSANTSNDKPDTERRFGLFSRAAVEKEEASFIGFGHRIHGGSRANMREEIASKPQQATMSRLQAIQNENARPTSVGLQSVAVPPSFATASNPSADITLAPKKVQRTKTPTLETDELAKLHPLTRTPRLCISMSELAKRSGVDARAGFILSLIDGTVTINDILSISSWSQTETASILCNLKSQNIIDFD